MSAKYLRNVAQGLLQVMRCTEAFDPAVQKFRVYGNSAGRCVEISAPGNRMLMDRRIARELAGAILEVCGPAEDLISDSEQANPTTVDFAKDGRTVVGFRSYYPPSLDEENLDTRI